MPEAPLFIFTLGVCVISCISFFAMSKKETYYSPKRNFVLIIEIVASIIWVSLLAIIIYSKSDTHITESIFLLLCAVLFSTLATRTLTREIHEHNKIQSLIGKLRENNEDLKEMDIQKTEFVSLASHQLRGPITALKGYTSMILEGDFGHVPDYLRSPLSKMMRSCQSLVIIINDFLDVTRTEARKMNYSFKPIDTQQLVHSVGQELYPLVKNKGLNFLIHNASEGDDVRVYADEHKLRQVVSNLIDNAVKYTSEGGITISISIIDQRVLISVHDTGIGINEHDIPNLFKKFSRTKTAQRANVTGTGLGLYVASHIVEAHGGLLTVESEGEGLGSTFTISLPTLFTHELYLTTLAASKS